MEIRGERREEIFFMLFFFWFLGSDHTWRIAVYRDFLGMKLENIMVNAVGKF